MFDNKGIKLKRNIQFPIFNVQFPIYNAQSHKAWKSQIFDKW